MIVGHPVVDKHPDGLHGKILRRPKLEEHQVVLRKLALKSQVCGALLLYTTGVQELFISETISRANPALLPAWAFFRGLGSGQKV